MINNERTNMKQCIECKCTPKNDEWAVNSNDHCMDCEQIANDYYNECQRDYHEYKQTCREENPEAYDDQTGEKL